MSDQNYNNWMDILECVKKNIDEPRRTQLIAFLYKYVKSPDKSQNKLKRSSKKDIQNKLISNNPHADSFANVLKKF